MLTKTFFIPNNDQVEQLENYGRFKEKGRFCGAKLKIVAKGVPVGLGEPVFDRLDADIAHAMMSINAVKGVEIGSGFNSVEQSGSEHGDELSPSGFLSNNLGVLEEFPLDKKF